MRTLIIQVYGTMPLLLHRVAKHQLRDEIASSATGGSSFEDEALKKMSKDEGGNPSVPVSWLRDAIRVGCSRIIVDGCKQLSFVKLQQSLHLPAGALPLRGRSNRLLEWEVYTSVQHASPGSKKMITVVAPMFRHWMVEIPISVDENQLDNSLLERIFNEAGKSGIGLFHPPKKQFGQFRALVQ